MANVQAGTSGSYVTGGAWEAMPTMRCFASIYGLIFRL